MSHPTDFQTHMRLDFGNIRSQKKTEATVRSGLTGAVRLRPVKLAAAGRWPLAGAGAGARRARQATATQRSVGGRVAAYLAGAVHTAGGVRF